MSSVNKIFLFFLRKRTSNPNATLMSSVNEIFLFFLRKRTSNPNE